MIGLINQTKHRPHNRNLYLSYKKKINAIFLPSTLEFVLPKLEHIINNTFRNDRFFKYINY